MLFNSLEFFVLLFVSWVSTKVLKTGKSRQVLLLCASFIFYAWTVPIYLSLLLGVISVSYIAGIIYNISRRVLVLEVAIIVLVGALVYFKYLGLLNFIIDWDNLPILPIGLSFFIFQAISYLIDLRRSEAVVEYSWLSYANYISFFPQLVSGPIERYSRLRIELNKIGSQGFRQEQLGVKLFVYGAFLKFVVANNLAIYDVLVYKDIGKQNPPTLLVASLVYFWRIYFDFKSYTLMARGAGHLLGVELVKNFDRPYLAKSLREFWRRWHMSLSNWLTSYLYIPLGGNRVSKVVYYRNIFLTMLIGGLWHGASFSFLLWGALHGLALIIERYFRLENLWFNRFWTLFVVWSLWIPFRLGTDDLMMFIRQILTGWSTAAIETISVSYIIVLMLSVIAYWIVRYLNFMKAPIYVLISLEIYFILILRGSDTSFIYFNF